MDIHECNPSKYEAKIKIFLQFLIAPKKVFTYYVDGADICGVCGEHIVVPRFYYGLITNVLYGLFGFLLPFATFRLPIYLNVLAFMLGSYLFHHIYSAATFAFGLWDTYDPEVRSSASCTEEAEEGLVKKIFWFQRMYVTSIILIYIFK